MKIKVGIIGASGYAGYELIKLLKKHPKVDLAVLNSRTYAGKTVKSVYKDFKDPKLKFTNVSLNGLNKLDVVFLAVPNTIAMSLVPKLKCKVIDLGADYRFKDAKVFEKVYKEKHTDKKTKAAYGLPELFKEKIKKSKVIGNPGCYATASILAALPIQKLAKNIIFDCKSGYSGAGANKGPQRGRRERTANDAAGAGGPVEPLYIARPLMTSSSFLPTSSAALRTGCAPRWA